MVKILSRESVKQIKDLFVNNKYFHVYMSLCRRADKRELVGYLEKHHVIPRAFGGLDDNKNIVKLTAREHFIAHLCLTRCTSGLSRYLMVHAAWLMMIHNGVHINSRCYARLKRDQAEAARISNTGKSYGRGIKHNWSPSKKHRAMLSAVNRGNTHALGIRYKRSPEENKKKSKRMMGNSLGLGNRSTTGLHWTATPAQNAANSMRMKALWEKRHAE